MKQDEFYKQLVSRYVQNTASVAELEAFFQLMKEGKLDEFIADEMGKEKGAMGEIKKAQVRRIPKTWIGIAAASAILLLLAGVFYLSKTEANQNGIVKNEKPSPLNDILPGGNKAVLTLADGSTIILDSVQNGTLSSQGNIKIIKLDDGQLAYDKSAVSVNPEVLYNTISTPRGGQYQLTLSDGSKVWLNAASSIRFPVTFSGNERKLELTGEGYFEVAHNAAEPFIVTKNNVEIKVLGTHFNVNSYDDESFLKVTLLEGSVKVSKGNESTLIAPGQQARISNENDRIIVKKEVDLDEALAWKNGKFIFQDADIKSVMRQLEKWYDVAVIYDKDVTNEEFVGSISRDVNISQILKMLEKTGAVKFEIKGKTIFVK